LKNSPDFQYEGVCRWEDGNYSGYGRISKKSLVFQGKIVDSKYGFGKLLRFDKEMKYIGGFERN